MKSITIAGNIRTFLQADFWTGRLFWLPRARQWFPTDRSHATWNARYANRAALTYLDPGGYRVGRIFDRQIKAHRAIWAIATGEWPSQIDHINGNRSDNRLDNLRSVSVAENNMNAKRRSDNGSGVTGVCWDAEREKWLVTVQGRYVGRFEHLDKAVIARSDAQSKAGFHKNHGRKEN